MTVSESLPANEPYSIRPPQRSDAKAFRMLLPNFREAAIRLVAVAGPAERVVAAGAATQSMRPKPPIGPGVDIHVIAPCRRRGIGGALLRQLKESAAQRGAEAVYGARKVEAGSDEERGWRYLGFEPLEKVIYHELPLDAIEPKIEPLFEWMRERAWIPEDATIIALCDADRDAVADLHLSVLGGDRGALLSKMRGEGLGAYHPVYSRVLLVGGKTMGCILAHRESKEVAVVDANILDPSVRGGWANLWLKLEASRGAKGLGIKTFVYATFDHYTDTRAFSEKLGGKETRRTLLMHCRLHGRTPAGDLE